MLGRLAATLRMAATWQLSFLYAVAFGGFVAFSVYLPTYLTTAYQLDRADAALRTAGFVVLAVAMRPSAAGSATGCARPSVLATAFAFVAVFAVLAAFQLPLIPVDTIAFLGMAAALGTGTGAVFALVARMVATERVGSVTGVVGAAGGSADSSRPWSWAWSTGLSAATPSDSCCSPPPLLRQGYSPRRSCNAAPQP
jgi:NNP family nitrate/nitrite transporter-like MFS transporter